LKEDKHEIFRAASDAQKIADFCLQLTPGNVKAVGKEETAVQTLALQAQLQRGR